LINTPIIDACPDVIFLSKSLDFLSIYDKYFSKVIYCSAFCA